MVYRGFTDVGQGPITAKCSVYCPAAYYNTSQTFGNTSAPSATSGRRCPFLKDLRVVLASAVSTVRLEAVTNMGQTDAYHRELCRAVKMTHTQRHTLTHSIAASGYLSVYPTILLCVLALSPLPFSASSGVQVDPQLCNNRKLVDALAAWEVAWELGPGKDQGTRNVRGGSWAISGAIHPGHNYSYPTYNPTYNYP